jgi:hypothetical protein
MSPKIKIFLKALRYPFEFVLKLPARSHFIFDQDKGEYKKGIKKGAEPLF